MPSNSHPVIERVCPDFSLSTPSGDAFGLQDLIKKNGLILVFTCNHCPYARAIWERTVALYPEMERLEVGMAAINPNFNPNYPDDDEDGMIKLIDEYQVPFPYLSDKTQEIAKAYDAVCTPDIYYMDAERRLIYRGQLDDNWKDESAVRQESLKNAVLAQINGEAIGEQFPTISCSIKWV